MDPILTVLRWGELERPIGNYGVMLAVAMLVGAFISARAAHRAGLDVGAVVAACGFTVGGALFGSYALFVLVELARTGDISSAVTQGGLVFYGAPLGGGLAYFYAAKKLELPRMRLLDLSIAGVPAAHAMGRIGCLLGGCCYGIPWEGPWAIRYTHPIAPASDPPVLRHPVPVYESALLLVLAFALVLAPPRRVGSGQRVGIYLAAYALIRIVTETYRGDGVRGVWFGVISTSQLISLAMMAAGVAMILRARKWRAV